jgi:hypothetical protein
VAPGTRAATAAAVSASTSVTAATRTPDNTFVIRLMWS